MASLGNLVPTKQRGSFDGDRSRLGLCYGFGLNYAAHLSSCCLPAPISHFRTGAISRSP